MSLLPPSSGAARVFSVPPLTFSTRDGKRYQRRPDIEAKISATFQSDPSQWPEAAKSLPAEVIVFLVRYISSHDADLAGNLVFELSRRIHSTARQWANGFGKIETEEILRTVDQQIIDLVLAEEVSNKSEFLEVAFSLAVKRRTLREIQRARSRPSSLRRTIEMEELSEPSDVRLGPLEQMLEIEDADRAVALLKRAQNAVKDQRHYKALLLRYGFGWPIDSQDPNHPTLAKHFGVSPRQIQNWLTAGLENIRTALGVKL